MSNYGLLDPRPLDNSEDLRTLKCESCGFEYSDNKEEEIDDFDSVEENGVCCGCFRDEEDREMTCGSMDRF